MNFLRNQMRRIRTVISKRKAHCDYANKSSSKFLVFVGKPPNFDKLNMRFNATNFVFIYLCLYYERNVMQLKHVIMCEA